MKKKKKLGAAVREEVEKSVEIRFTHSPQIMHTTCNYTALRGQGRPPRGCPSAMRPWLSHAYPLLTLLPSHIPSS